ncbi:hypothetical protein NTE_00393 [Candidatus Nitrososphaera evergladensis SR1]|uniref:Uncharacterized protein n=1 Tax=Candidatus Nitrososphaera evergladensis SR1 TaxID=1459636 RepID=A0A075MMU4_9ARCH|nr:hypothetical protein [Candidatus Nitrososphaera evergladensis]AIF82475.1 hypothetical protein NTE_00393 [Candidatus Nitrososphaera evergladensis SR1]
MPQDYDNSHILHVIESALELIGKGSKQVILDYLNVRYGMNTKLIVDYKDEFENYLRETIGDSAEIIISKIDATLYESRNNNNNRYNDNCNNNTNGNGHHNHNHNHNKNTNTTVLQEQKRSVSGKPAGYERKRITDVVHFLICDSCFWCASVLRECHEPKCLSCGSKIVSTVPVMSNEKFLVEVDEKRGISLSFREVGINKQQVVKPQ